MQKLCKKIYVTLCNYAKVEYTVKYSCAYRNVKEYFKIFTVLNLSIALFGMFFLPPPGHSEFTKPHTFLHASIL